MAHGSRDGPDRQGRSLQPGIATGVTIGIATGVTIGVAAGARLSRPTAAGPDKPPLADIHVHMSEHFAKWQLPDDLIWVDALPLTTTGKISKLTQRQQFAEYKLPDLR